MKTAFHLGLLDPPLLTPAPTPGPDAPAVGVDVAAVARGEVAAIEAMYRELCEPVYAFVFWRVGGVRQDAEDVTQETFVTALSSIGRFEGRSTLYTWMCGIARNLAHARLRSRARDGQDAERMEVGTGDTEGTPDRLFERAETEELVGRALTELPPHYQKALLEKYVHHRSFAEMAAEGGATPKAVEGTVQRAKRALSRALAQLGIGCADGDAGASGASHG